MEKAYPYGDCEQNGTAEQERVRRQLKPTAKQQPPGADACGELPGQHESEEVQVKQRAHDEEEQRSGGERKRSDAQQQHEYRE